MRPTSSNFVTIISLPLLALLALAFTGCTFEEDISHPSENPVVQIYDAPAGYYDTVNYSNPEALRVSLHELIDDHNRIPYTASSTDTWNVLEIADEDPNNSGNVLDVYMNASYIKHGGGNEDYNREHSWPSSYGFGDNDGISNYPYTDCHHLFICNDGYNSARSNKPYGSVGGSGSEYTTEVNNSVGGGSGSYPGWSNWASTTYWETWLDRRGDVARALFYMDVRYEGGVHGVTGYWEPDLILTNTLSLIESSNTGNNETVAYMGLLSVLLQWHDDDPVSAREIWRNDAVQNAQGNRNPFIDHPEWVNCLFAGACSGEDTTPPGAPSALFAYAGNEFIDLAWANNPEVDLAGYTVYRASSSGGPYTQVNSTLHSISSFHDVGLTNDIPYFYLVTATDISGNESSSSSEVTATPDANSTGGGGEGEPVFINEFHYDNDGLDTGEFFEIAGPAGTNLLGWQVIGYNGNGGGVYGTINLSGLIPEQMNGLGTLAFDFTSMQNGSPDALALVNNLGEVVIFISYEGSCTATDGPAVGMTSIDIVVEETSNTPVGQSLQLGGTGSAYGDFTWQSPLVRTYGEMNVNQVFSSSDSTPPEAPTGLNLVAGDGFVILDWENNSEDDLAGYSVYRSTSSGGPYIDLTGSLTDASQYPDLSVSNGTTYFYVVTATDDYSNESAESLEESATPESVYRVTWINEIHYENSGTDRNEFVEIAGTGNLDLTGWSIVAYNGADGLAYDTLALSGFIKEQTKGIGTKGFYMPGLQNDRAGLALVDDNEQVWQFISYEGSFLAMDGPAAGMTSADIGVSESDETSLGYSLQLKGTGVLYGAFIWSQPTIDSFNLRNSYQIFEPLDIHVYSQ